MRKIFSIFLMGIMLTSFFTSASLSQNGFSINQAFAENGGTDKITICHVPPGNPENAQITIVSEKALDAHLAHGDTLGSCPGLLVEEYVELITKLDIIGNDIGETTVTPKFVEEIRNDLDRIKQIVIELQMIGFDGLIDADFQDDKAIGTISFFDEITSEVLFEITIPDGTMAIFTGFAMLEEFQDSGVEQTFDQIADLINSSSVIYQTVISVQNEDDALNFVLSNIGKFHPSTGNTVDCKGFSPAQCLLKITFEVAKCLIGNIGCRTGISAGVALLQSGQVDDILPYYFPLVTINVKQFNDLNDNGGTPETGEQGIPGWEFAVRAFDLEDSSIIEDILDPLSPLNVPTIVATDETRDTTGVVSFVELSIPRSTSSITISETQQPGWKLTSLEGVDRFLDFDAENDIPFIGAVKEYPVEFFGNVRTSGILNVEFIINEDGGNISPSDFTVNIINAENVSPNGFLGSSDGTKVTMDPGEYQVTIVPVGIVGPFTDSLSSECSSITSGPIVHGFPRTCIIIIDDLTPPPSSFEFFENFDEPGAMDSWIGCVGNPFCTKSVATSAFGFDPPSSPYWGIVTSKQLPSPFCSGNFNHIETISKDFVVPVSGNYEVSGTLNAPINLSNTRTAQVQIDTDIVLQKSNGEATLSNTIFLDAGQHRVNLITKVLSFCPGQYPVAFDDIKIELIS